LHFGLNRASSVDRVEIAWPSGTRQTLTNVEANQWIKVKEGVGIVGQSKVTARTAAP
jgi:hypothetical protein